MGSVVRQVFAVSDWSSLQQSITAPSDAVDACNTAVAALQKCLKRGRAQLVGSAAAGLHLPRCDADIVVLLPDFRVQQHADALSEVASALKSPTGQSEGFSKVQLGEFSVQCNRKGLNVDILVGSTEIASPLTVLDPRLTGKQRQALSASTAVATTAFLQQQPALFKTAVRLVKYWAKRVHANDWNAQARNRPKSYLLVLLTLKAYQQYLAAAAAAAAVGAGSSSSSSDHDQAAALDRIMLNFLRLTAQLSSSTLLYWEMQYDKEVVQQVLARPDLVHTLRPKNCEAHPIVLDPANPTNNVAAAVPDISRLVQLAAADLAAVEGDMIRTLEQQLQQLNTTLNSRIEQQVQQLKTEMISKLEHETMQLKSEQGKQLATLVAYHKIIGNPRTTCSYPCTFPVSKWLPDSKSVSLVGPSHWPTVIPGLWLQMFNLPYKAAGYGDKDVLAGVELRLVSSKTPELKSIVELGLPIPIKVLEDTTVTLERSGDSDYDDEYDSVTDSVTELGTEVRGVISNPAGMQVVFSHGVLSQLGLVHFYAGDEKQDLDCLKQYVDGQYNVKMTLHFQIGS